MPLAGLGGARGDFAGEIRIAADPLLQQRDELCRPDYRVRRHAMMGVKRAAVIHRPLADLDIGEADIDPRRRLRHHVDDGTGSDITHMRGLSRSRRYRAPARHLRPRSIPWAPG